MNNHDEDLENTFKILLATDIHLGYAETDPVLDKDTFVTFEEILQLAVNEDVDFILLGGDLFHDTKPSPYCINKCTELIRKYCLGDKPVPIEFLSDASYNFTQSQNPMVNWEDPNLNVSYPIFSIHGNHDDPTGRKHISAMDLMSSMGLVNYFGRANDLANVDVWPVLLGKGTTQLALFGLSHVRDERLSRLFLEKKVVFHQPEDPEGWFNLLVWHQNRADRGPKNFIPESTIPAFFNLAVWGHEHDCRIQPVLANNGEVFISQPGSSVATSLAQGEAIPKHVGILRIKGHDFDIAPIELKTVRPFIYRDMILPPPKEFDEHEKRAMKEVSKVIEEMMDEAGRLGRAGDLLPLIRLNIRYRDERQVFNAIRYGQKYVGKVANPEHMVKFKLIRRGTGTRAGTGGSGIKTEEDEDEADGDLPGREDVARVEDLVEKSMNDQKLEILSIVGLNEAIKKYIDADDQEAPSLIVKHQEQMTLKKLEELAPEEDELEECLERLLAAREGRDLEDAKKVLDNPDRVKDEAEDVVTIDDDAPVASTSRPLKGPGSRGGKGSRGGGSGSRGGRGSRGGKVK